MSGTPYVLKLHDCENSDRTVYSVETRAGERFDTVRIEPFTPPPATEWLWAGRIALGRVTVIEGAPGSGKSRVAFDLAARVRDGLAWPDGTPALLPAADVLVISRHDEAGPVAAGNKAAGGDACRFHRFDGFRTSCPERDEFGERPVAFPFDLEALQYELENHPTIGVVIIDPLSDFCAAPRLLAETLHELNDLAARSRVVVIVTVPANCRIDARGGIRATSRWPTDAARCVWCLITDPDDPTRRLLVAKRMNFCREPDGMAFRIDERGGVGWEADSRINPHDPLGEISASEQCLVELLSEGPLRASIVFRLGAEQGFKPKDLRSAAKRLAISTKRVGFAGNGHWIWTRQERAVCIVGEDGGAAHSDWDSPASAGGEGLEWGHEPRATPDPHPDPPTSRGSELPCHDVPSLSECNLAAGPEGPACEHPSAECDALADPTEKPASRPVGHVRPLSKRKAKKARRRLARQLAAEIVTASVLPACPRDPRFDSNVIPAENPDVSRA